MSASLLWFIVGVAMMLLEFVIPGLIVIFFGVGAWITALLMLILPLPIEAQLIIFLLGSVASLIFLRKYLKKNNNNPEEVKSADDLVGLIGEITKEVTPNKAGSVFLSGTTWKVEADETLSLGEKCVVIAKKGLVLTVKKA